MQHCKPSEVTEPGVYRWVDRDGVNHVGYVYADRGGRLSGNFLSEEGCLRSVSLHPEDNTNNGWLLGPLSLPAMPLPPTQALQEA